MTSTIPPASPRPPAVDPSIGPGRRRELARQYKECGRPAGIYAIRNLTNGAMLVDASLDVEAAINRHRFELSRKDHRDAALLEDWIRCGAESFRFEVVDLVKKRDDPAFDERAELADLLAIWREQLGCGERGGYQRDLPSSKGSE
jgi:hypothetical protein